MIWWVYQQVIKNKNIDQIVIATDDVRTMEKCNEHKMNAILTSEIHDTPTSRLYEVSTIIDSDLYLLVMGDEPLVDQESFSLILPKEPVSEYYVAALTNVLDNPQDVIDFSNQKVVTNSDRNALMISRSPIPYPKGTLDFEYEKVTGVQLFSKKVLEFYDKTPRSILEKAEVNDLMRFIENGINVKMVKSPYKTLSVDTPKDLEKVREIIRNRHSE